MSQWNWQCSSAAAGLDVGQAFITVGHAAGVAVFLVVLPSALPLHLLLFSTCTYDM